MRNLKIIGLAVVLSFAGSQVETKQPSDQILKDVVKKRYKKENQKSLIFVKKHKNNLFVGGSIVAAIIVLYALSGGSDCSGAEKQWGPIGCVFGNEQVANNLRNLFLGENDRES